MRNIKTIPETGANRSGGLKPIVVYMCVRARRFVFDGWLAGSIFHRLRASFKDRRRSVSRIYDIYVYTYVRTYVARRNSLTTRYVPRPTTMLLSRTVRHVVCDSRMTREQCRATGAVLEERGRRASPGTRLFSIFGQG